MKKDAESIQKEITKRKIDCLVHFTPTINLLGIYECGAIIPRNELTNCAVFNIEMADYVQFPDKYRFDGKSYINTSIQRPNKLLFSRFIENKKDESFIRWCIIKIDTKYILKDNTLFSVTNAANKYNRTYIGIDGTFEKFRQMFAEKMEIQSSTSCRILTRLFLPPNFTTDEQAEVLVKDHIQVADFISVIFQNKDDLATTKAALSEYECNNFVVDSTMFP